jgi:hypothetical protein
MLTLSAMKRVTPMEKDDLAVAHDGDGAAGDVARAQLRVHQRVHLA